MPPERRRKLPPEEAAAFERILERLTREEREALAKIYDLTGIRLEEFFSTLARMSSRERELFPTVVRKSITLEPMTDEEYDVLYKYETFIRKLKPAPVLANIAPKLTPMQIAILAEYARTMPELFKPPEEKPPKPPEERKPPEEKKPPEKVPVKRVWRSWAPFKTGEFIRAYLMAKGEATPYETYRAFVYVLTQTITDESFRKEVEEAGAVRVDGTIDRKLAEDIIHKRIIKAAWEEELPTIALPFVHKSSYNNFRRYFYILETLGLIERVGKREWDAVRAFFKQKYRIVKGKENDKAWEAPQRYLYPLAWLGKRRYERLLEDTADRLEEDLEEFLSRPYEERRAEIIKTIEKFPEWQDRLKLREVAAYWGVSVKEMLKRMYYLEYQPLELLRERAVRVVREGAERGKILREKIERREEKHKE
ncbi:MAG: hypothetical protein J7J91_06685 [Deltaproteobacteria bacterium]|nr:hypothetical protein [Deltaproteobacteria bacterium]